MEQILHKRDIAVNSLSSISSERKNVSFSSLFMYYLRIPNKRLRQMKY